MLDKLGKADIGETSKAMGLIFVIGLIIAVIGGTLAVMVDNDTTDYADIDDTDNAVDATKMIGEFHVMGKGFVGLLAFWFPIIGIAMIAIGLGVLHLGRNILYVVLFSIATAVLLVSLNGIIPVHVIGAVFAGALGADIISTIASRRFPAHEANFVISSLHAKMGTARTLAVYCTIYCAVFGIGYHVLGDIYTVLAILASVHVVAAASNMSHGIAAKKIPVKTTHRIN